MNFGSLGKGAEDVQAPAVLGSRGREGPGLEERQGLW